MERLPPKRLRDRMNLLYLSPDFPPNYANFIVELAKAGVNVFGVGEAEFSGLPERTRTHLQWYARCDLRDPQAVVRAAALLNAEVLAPRGLGRIDLCESHNEAWMKAEALLNEEFGLPGIRPQDLEKLQRKSAMKSAFLENRIPAARGLLVQDPDACFGLAEKTGYPLLLKPDIGVGASGVRRGDDRSQLAYYLERIRQPYVLEEFLHGRMVTYDGLADWDSDVVFESSLIYGDGVLESVRGMDTFFYTRREIPRPLSEMGRKIVKIFAIRRKFFHFEFFETSQGELAVVEINARPPGGSIVDVMNFSADEDLYRVYAAMLARKPLRVSHEKKFFCAYAGRKDRPYRNPHERILERYGRSIVDCAENPPLFWPGMGKTRYVFRSEEEDEILEIRDFILDM